MNAANLKKNGAGFTLMDKVRISRDLEEIFSYKSPCFDSEHVKKVFNTVLTDPSYKENMMKLKA